MLEFAKLQEKTDQGTLLDDALDDLKHDFIACMLMHHDPSDRCIGVSQAPKQFFHICEGFLFLQLAFDDVSVQALAVGSKAFKALAAEVFDLGGNDVVLEGFLCSRETLPVREQVDKLATIDRNDPVVWKVFVADFTHLSLSFVEDARHEGQQAEYNRCLG